MLIDASHSEETRVVVLESKKVEDFDFESLKKTQLSGNIYLAKVTRVEPSLQAAFLDYGGNRHGFLAFSEIHPDYYQIPLEERLAPTTEKNETKEDSKSRKVSRKKSSKVKAEDSKVSDESALKSGEINLNEDTITDTSELTDKDDIDLSHSVLPTDEDRGFEDANDEEPIVKKQYRKFRIQEVIKVRQILLIQVVKEERGNKGAALTTFLSLAGRYCVLMPNTPRGGGISRKITNLADRKKLKEIANSLLVPEGSGLIIRTAGSNRTKLEIKRDYEYLIRQWEQIRNLTLSSIAPTTIYEEGSLIKRAIRDLYSRTIDEILVEGDRGYREAKDYMKMLMPSHAKNVKKYEDLTPLFSKYQVEDHLAAMFNPTAQLKSGGYIVINVTEALVAVDVNSGRATKETSIEDTALKTNLEAADEVARQIKLRDLAGLIVIDFIDMDERKNNIAVERRMKERLKNDRARTQVGRISIFGLLEMSRQRLRPGMIETSTQTCPHCQGTGVNRSDDSLSLAILRELEEEGIKKIFSAIKVQVPIDIANYMLNEKRNRILTIEDRYNLSIKIEALNDLVSPDYRLERIKSGIKHSNQNGMKKSEALDKSEVTIEKTEKNESETTLNKDEDPNKRRRRRRRKTKQKTIPSKIKTDNDTNSSIKDTNSVQLADSKMEENDISSSERAHKPVDKIKKIASEPTKENSSTKNISKEKNQTEITKPKNIDIKKKITTNQKRTRKESPQKPLISEVPKETSKTKNKEKISNNEKLIETTTNKESIETEEKQSKRKGWWNRAKKKT